jgi:hypothetical protein
MFGGRQVSRSAFPRAGIALDLTGVAYLALSHTAYRLKVSPAMEKSEEEGRKGGDCEDVELQVIPVCGKCARALSS